MTAPNLGTKNLHGFDLASALAKWLGRPVRMANDAEIQGLAAIEGRGVIPALRGRGSEASSSSSRASDGCGQQSRADARRLNPVEIVVAN